MNNSSRIPQVILIGCGVILLMAGLLSIRFTSPVAAQGGGCPLQLANYAWPQGTATEWTVVTVYLDPAWTATPEINALKQAFTNWEAQQGSGASGCNCHVRFEYTSTEGTGTYRYRVLREMPSVTTFRGEFYIENVGSQRLIRAMTKINPGVSVPAALTKVMAHEIGHTFGLFHCPDGSCLDTSTVMAPYNPANGLNDTSWVLIHQRPVTKYC